MASYLLHHPDAPHGRIRICFTPDEEIGSGIRHIDLDLLGADFAYTLDGADLGTSPTNRSPPTKPLSPSRVYRPIRRLSASWSTPFTWQQIWSRLPMYTRTPETTQGKRGFHTRLRNGRLSSLRRIEPNRATSNWKPSPTAFLRALCDAINNPSLAPRSAFRLRRNTVTCATGSKTICDRWTLPLRRSAAPALPRLQVDCGNRWFAVNEMGLPTPTCLPAQNVPVRKNGSACKTWRSRQRSASALPN